MSFTPENALEAALVAASSSPAARPTFYRALLKSELFVIDDGPSSEAGDGTATLQPGTNVRLRHIDWDGIPHLAVFSSLVRLQQVIREEVRYLRLRAPDLFALVAGAHVLLNPGLPVGKRFTPDEIGQLHDGSLLAPPAREVVAAPRQILLGQPAQYPTHLTSGLQALLEREPRVIAAYLAHYFDPASSDQPHTLIGIEVTGDWDRIVADVALVLREISREGEQVDLVRIDDSQLSRHLGENTQPFFFRKPDARA